MQEPEIPFDEERRLSAELDQALQRQRKAEEALHISEEYFRSVVENVSDLILIANVDGKIRYLSPSVKSVLGYQAAEEIGRNVFDYVHPDDRQNLRDRFKQTVRQPGTTQSLEYRCRHQDGSWRIVEAIGRYRHDRRATDGIMVTIRDVTERKRMEMELSRARDAALESVRLKSQFMANMSHEIRTPMNAILGMTSLVLETPLSPKQRHFMEIVSGAVDTLMTLINDILDFSKIEAGKLRVESIELNVPDIVRDVVRMLEGKAHSKRLVLSCRIPDAIPLRLCGDPTRLRQVLTNLIGNAVKFTLEGEVSVSVVMEGETPEQTTLRFEVRDTGIGISKEYARRLFQPFSQADGSTTRKFGGTGLGLAISKQLVELMNGDIGVQSASDRGSQFWFRVKFENAPAASVRGGEFAEVVEKSAPLTPAVSSAIQLLLVEDNSANQEIAQYQLHKLGYASDVVSNGQEALQAIQTGKYNLVLMDCLMPEMDGYEATRRIRQLPGAIGQTVVLAMSASVLESDRVKCLDAGMNDFVGKPFKLSELQAVLERWLPFLGSQAA